MKISLHIFFFAFACVAVSPFSSWAQNVSSTESGPNTCLLQYDAERDARQFAETVLNAVEEDIKKHSQRVFSHEEKERRITNSAQRMLVILGEVYVLVATPEDCPENMRMFDPKKEE